MSLYKQKGSPFWYYEFEVGGHRFRGSSGTSNKREAVGIEAARRAEERQRARGRASQPAGVPQTIDLAFDEYWLDQAQHVANSKDIKRDMHLVQDYLASRERPVLLMSDITQAVALDLREWKRKQFRWGKPKYGRVTPAQVNRSTTEILRRVFNHIARKWKVRLTNEPTWNELLLEEPRERVRVLREDEDHALATAYDPDYERVRQFSLVSGLRQAESLLLWSQVDLAGRQITLKGKGDEDIHLPISDAMYRILTDCLGHDRRWVFTYRAARTHKGRVKGRRYPISTSGLKTHHRRRRKRAGVTNYRWHDNRHHFATDLLRRTGNLRLVQRALNHRKPETTAKYAHVLDDALLDGLNKVGDARTVPRKTTP
jgi:site-specific recombinase XerD